MKLKTYSIKREEVETEIELPVYFYLQGELMNDEYIKIDIKGKTSIIREYNSFKIEVYYKEYSIPEHYITRSLSSEEEFNDALKHAIDSINE